MFSFYASSSPDNNAPAADIERYRAKHRRMCRGQPDVSPSSQIEDLDVQDGRTRKISAKWRQKQQQARLGNQGDDGYWPEACGTEMHVGFNAFDFSASPEAFYEPEEPEQQVEDKPRCPENNQSEQQQEFRSASLWERRFPGLRQPGGPIRQLPTLGQDALWGAPVHYATHDAQRRALYYQPQYYA